MVLRGCPPPRGYLSVFPVSLEEHGIKGPVPKPLGGPLVGPAQPPVPLPHQHATTDPRSVTVQMSHAAQDPPTAMTAHAVYAEEEIQTMQGRTMGRAHGHGRGHPGGNLWVKDPTTGIWTAGGASPSCIPNPMGSGPTGPHSMEERDVRGVYSQPPATKKKHVTAA